LHYNQIIFRKQGGVFLAIVL